MKQHGLFDSPDTSVPIKATGNDAKTPEVTITPSGQVLPAPPPAQEQERPSVAEQDRVSYSVLEAYLAGVK